MSADAFSVNSETEAAMVEALQETEAQIASANALEILDKEAPEGNGEPATKKRKREVKEYEGTQETFDAAWVKLKAIFAMHPLVFSKWLAEFVNKLIKLELKFQADFFSKLSPKQKMVVVDEVGKAEAKVQKQQEKDSMEVDSKTGKKVKRDRPHLQGLDEAQYEKLQQTLHLFGHPLLSIVEHNFLKNVGERHFEHKQKVLLTESELKFAESLLENVPKRESLVKSTVADK